MEGLIRGLQASRADINLQNKQGETPLHIMCRNPSIKDPLDEKLFGTLIHADADPNLRDSHGESAVFSLFLTESFNFGTKKSGEHMC